MEGQIGGQLLIGRPPTGGSVSQQNPTGTIGILTLGSRVVLIFSASRVCSFCFLFRFRLTSRSR